MLTFAKRFTLDPPPFRNVMLIIKGNKKIWNIAKVWENG